MSDTQGPPSHAPAPSLDRRGRDLVVRALETIVDRLGLTEQRSDDGEAALAVTGAGGPLAGQRIGEFRVYTGADGLRLVYSALTVEAFGMDTHQIYGFTGPDSAVPHLFLDTAISPNTEGTFHFGLDLAPRVDLGASFAYSQAVYAGLDGLRAPVLADPEVEGVPSLGPLQWSLRSPWMVAAIVAPDVLPRLEPVTTAYVERWLDLVAEGLPGEASESAAWQDLARRDRLSREAMFSAAANPVWGLLDKLVGAEAAQAMRALLLP